MGGDETVAIGLIALSIAVTLISISHVITIFTTKRLWQQQQRQQKQLEQLLKEQSE